MIPVKGGVRLSSGFSFSWSHVWYASSHPDYDPYGELYGTLAEELEYGTPGKLWSAKEPRRVGERVRVGDLILILDQIFRKHGGSIPGDVWRARRELEEKIMALPESPF